MSTPLEFPDPTPLPREDAAEDAAADSQNLAPPEAGEPEQAARWGLPDTV